jgi:7,8-dihydropterin-6-yl-methyl-4-(beta-D-ribofuranosyl)aminobenzene 5'-phosphate synthase
MEYYANDSCFHHLYSNVWKSKVGGQKVSVISPVNATNNVKLEILYDNEALNGFRRAHGFSCLVEEKGILFDTGGDINTLFFNMQKSQVDPSSIRMIVLSHEHSDHIGGIQIINYCEKVDVFIPASFSGRFKDWLASHPNVKLYEIQELGEVCKGVFTTGELGQSIKEQSLIIKTGNGLTVITGCAHPGLENILKVTSKLGDIYGVVGGFHDFNRLEALKGMRLIAPCHCTVRKREIFNLYPKTCKKCSVGCTILI